MATDLYYQRHNEILALFRRSFRFDRIAYLTSTQVDAPEVTCGLDIGKTEPANPYQHLRYRDGALSHVRKDARKVLDEVFYDPGGYRNGFGRLIDGEGEVSDFKHLIKFCDENGGYHTLLVKKILNGERLR